MVRGAEVPRARVIAADCPRALNELVGLSDSSLM